MHNIMWNTFRIKYINQKLIDSWRDHLLNWISWYSICWIKNISIDIRQSNLTTFIQVISSSLIYLSNFFKYCCWLKKKNKCPFCVVWLNCRTTYSRNNGYVDWFPVNSGCSGPNLICSYQILWTNQAGGAFYLYLVFFYGGHKDWFVQL